MRAVRGCGAGMRTSWIRSWGGAHIVLYSDGLFRSGNIYLGAAIHISEPQYIHFVFQSGNTYFRAAIHISEQHYIFQRRRYTHGEDTIWTR